MAVDIAIDEHNSRKIAKALQERFAEIGIEIRLGQAYEAMAVMAGFRNWATMKAALDDRPKGTSAAPGSSLSQALLAAVQQASKNGIVDETEADDIASAAQGDKEAVRRLAAACGHVPVAMIDVDSEIERWHRAFPEFLEKNVGSRNPFERNNMAAAATEFASTRGYDQDAAEDFFNDWLSERIEEDRSVPGTAETRSIRP